jgi:hypothetical protein
MLVKEKKEIIGGNQGRHLFALLLIRHHLSIWFFNSFEIAFARFLTALAIVLFVFAPFAIVAYP